MRLAEYSDDDLIEEIRHRGIKIEIRNTYIKGLKNVGTISIGGVIFDIK